MGHIPSKTREDLEFDQVLAALLPYAITPMGKASCQAIRPLPSREEAQYALSLVTEYTASFANENRIPNHGFEDISAALRLLKIDNSVLEIQAFRNIAALNETVNTLLVFLKKFKTYYPQLHQLSGELYVNKEIQAAVDAVIDRFGEIRNNASEDLYQIRKSIQTVRGKIGSSFNKALAHYQSQEYLDDIRESVIDNRRVLAVKAMHRRKVKGGIMGSSKTGSIVFIEPETTLQFSHELQNLLFEEGEEIQKILRQLTDQLRPFLSLLSDAQDFLVHLDMVYAKAKYAQAINACMPQWTDDHQMELLKAYHPLLLQTHLKEKKVTHPQDISLDQDRRIVVISGPNAGGKSITLKTVGLLQLMVQSGILIPVHERSTVTFFERILTDIGDNQSIENHLSTYSYRLKNMKTFLKKCNAQTLFLIDEFGTGSDPELGGALAETILEDFYERGAYGIITTHYANLKALADEQTAMVNANMQFDPKTLEPVFKLIMGEAGSSFTFEVAQKNGLPFGLINRAKKKIERGKVRFDATIAKLQKERKRMAESGRSLQEEATKAQQASEKLEVLNEKVKKKLSSYQEMYDHNQRMIVLGNKVNDAAEKYFMDQRKRPLIAQLLQLVETENAKRKKKTAALAKKERAVKKQVQEELKQAIAPIRKAKKETKKVPLPPKPKVPLKVGDRVRITDSKSVGSIDSIEKNKAIVNYGLFTTQVSLDQLEAVQ